MIIYMYHVWLSYLHPPVAMFGYAVFRGTYTAVSKPRLLMFPILYT